jgi:exodeoxyribonuclease VII small subunit
MTEKTKQDAGTDAEALTYEQALERLEAIVKRLEAGNLPLDESLRLFEEGDRLGKVCSRRLNEAELRIERLVGASGRTEDMPSAGLGDDG